MLIALLFIIAEKWNKPKCSAPDECTKKMWYIKTMVFYLGVRKTEIMKYAGKRMKQECLIECDNTGKEK